MTVRQTILVLPCHGLADLPGRLEGRDADEVLALWTAAWHPAVVQRTGTAPKCHAADDLSFRFEDALLLLPRAAGDWLAEDFVDLAESSGATVLTCPPDHGGHRLRDEVVREILLRTTPNAGHASSDDPAEPQAAPLDQQPLDQQLVDDFFAFGYWYLQTELLSYQMRYTSGLDADTLGEKIVAAAAAAMAHQPKEARKMLAAGFGILADESAHYYPVDCYLLDLTLVAKFNCVDGLTAELSTGRPRNVWMTGETLQHLAEMHPSTLALLRGAVEAGQASLLGGEWNELPTSLVPRAMLARNLAEGRRAFQQHAGAVPEIFARRRFGLAPAWPSLLRSAGIRGAVHATFDDGRFPALPARTAWRGEGPATVDALGKTALDASRPEAALTLGSALGQSMESDFVATLVLAHWAGQRTEWLDDLERGWKY